MRQFWEYADATENRYSLQAIRAVIAARQTNWTNLFTQFASWNTLPAGSYSERGGYPTPVLTLNKTLSRSAPSTGWRTVNLPHMSSSTIRIAPSSSLSTRKKVLIQINGPNTSHGTNALIQRRYRNGTVTHSMIPLSSYGNASLLRDFNRASISSMYLVVSNTSTAMKDCGKVYRLRRAVLLLRRPRRLRQRPDLHGPRHAAVGNHYPASRNNRQVRCGYAWKPPRSEEKPTCRH